MTRARDIANVTVTPTFPDGSINIADLDIDGGTDIGAALVDADLMVVDDGAGGTNKKATMSRLATYMGTKIGGGMEFIASSGAISDAASASFTQFDATKYDHYQFMFQHVIPATDAQDLLAHASTDGGSNYDTTNGNYHNNGATDRAGFLVAGLVGSETNEYGISGEFKLLAPHNTGYTYATTFAPLMTDATNIKMADPGETGTSNNIFATVHMVAADVDAIQFKFTSGNIESGEITMFGIVNS